MADLSRIITQLELSVHTYWKLYKAELFTIAKVIDKSSEQIEGLLGSREYVDELRSALLFAGYQDPWPELGDAQGLHDRRHVATLGLPPQVLSPLIDAQIDTLAKLLEKPPDDLLSHLSWEEYQELRSRLIELGYLHPVDPHL